MTTSAAKTAPLPREIPVFPLGGVLLLPAGQLPLNIFEPRYVAMVEDALKTDRVIGMVQPRQSSDGGGDKLFEIGCAGRITAFEETDDGRYLITLTGLSRFKVKEELDHVNGYRRFVADWTDFEADLNPKSCLDLDRDKLKDLLGNYFNLQQISCDWDSMDNVTDGKLITCLSMICTFDSNEKQALLEAACCKTRADMFMTMLEMAVRDGDCSGGCH